MEEQPYRKEWVASHQVLPIHSLQFLLSIRSSDFLPVGDGRIILRSGFFSAVCYSEQSGFIIQTTTFRC